MSPTSSPSSERGERVRSVEQSVAFFPVPYHRAQNLDLQPSRLFPGGGEVADDLEFLAVSGGWHGCIVGPAVPDVCHPLPL